MNISLPNINVFKNIIKSHNNLKKIKLRQSVHLFSLRENGVSLHLHWGKRASLYNIVNALKCLFVP